MDKNNAITREKKTRQNLINHNYKENINEVHNIYYNQSLATRKLLLDVISKRSICPLNYNL